MLVDFSHTPRCFAGVYDAATLFHQACMQTPEGAVGTANK